MDAIKTYLDNVFAAFPQTQRVLALKDEMLANMEEKYQALKQEGKSEHEAVGGVIANFGSIDEIAAELGIDTNKDEPDDILHLSAEETRAYLNQVKKSGFFIGIAVWVVLLGVSVMLLLDMKVTGTWTWKITSDAAGIFVLFLAIAAAVPVLIINGLKMNSFNHLGQQDIRLDTKTRAEIEQERQKFAPRFAAQISVGVAAILLAVGAFVFFSETVGTIYDSLPPALFVLIIGFAVFLFITAGTVYYAYDVLLGKRGYANRQRFKASERLIGTIAAVYWPLMVAVYLAWSFIGRAWDISWLVWPIASVAFGAIAGGVSAWHEAG